MKITVLFLFIALAAGAQTNPVIASTVSNSPAGGDQSAGARAEKIRTGCVAGRRVICGRILQVLPGGLVVDSGYTDLLRPPLSNTWLVPGRVVASRPQSLIESAEPGSPCVGVVMLTDLPKIRPGGPRPKLYDYVVLLGYPTGQATYTSVGTLQKTVRRFSANLGKAVSQNFDAAEKAGAGSLTK